MITFFSQVKKQKFAVLFLFVTVVLVVTVTVIAGKYSLQIFNAIPQADDWRMIAKYIMPLEESGFSLKRLWSDIPHPLPIVGTMLTLSYYFDELHFRSFPYLFFVFVILKLVVIYYSFIKAAAVVSEHAIYHKILAMLMFALIVFSLNSGIHYNWWLVYVQYIYHFFAFVFLLFSLLYLQTGKTKFLLLLFLLGMVLLLSARVFGLPWMLSTFCVLGFRLIFVRGSEFIKTGNVLLAIVVMLVIEKMFYWAMDIELHQENSFQFEQMKDVFLLWWEDSLGLLNYIAASFASGLLNFDWFINEKGYSESSLLTLIYVYNVIFLICVAICLIRIKSTAYLIPLIFFCFLSIMTLAAMFLRVDSPSNWLQCYFPRYISYKDLMPIAIIWVLIVFTIELGRDLLQKILLNACVISFFIGSAVLYEGYRKHKELHKQSINYGQHIRTQQLSFGYRWAVDESFRVPGKNVCEVFLETTKWKFHPEYPCDINAGLWKWNVLRFIGDNHLTVLFNK